MTGPQAGRKSVPGQAQCAGGLAVHQAGEGSARAFGLCCDC